MRRLYSLAVACAAASLHAAPADTLRPVDLVDVFAGTSNSRWMMFPGPTLPFGMVKLSPDNQGNVWNGGYEYTNNSVAGFSHLHGMSLAGVSFMPFVGRPRFGEEYWRFFPGEADGPFGDMWTAGYRSRIDKASEQGAPGYYRVDLVDAEVTVELTATARCGLVRTTFPASDEAYLLLDFDPPTEERSEVFASRLTRHGPREVRGSITFANGYVDATTVHFVTRFDAELAEITGWQYAPYTGEDVNYGTAWRRACSVAPVVDSFAGAAGSGVALRFATEAGQAVTAATALSFVSEANALLNWERELGRGTADFEAVRAAAEAEWSDLLASVEVEGPEHERRKFYTNYYRAFTGKNLLSDVNGEYVDMCEQVRQVEAPADAVYSSDALWGAQWNLFPLWTLTAPDRANSFAAALLELRGRGGWIPEAPVGLEYSPIMGAQHQNALLVSAVQKGIARFDPDTALAAIRHDYLTPGIEHPCGGFAGNRHLAGYMEDGYVAEEVGPASNTMEYAFDDWCLAELARGLGDDSTADHFARRAGNWRNLYDPATGYLRRRHRDGRWVEDFDPQRFGTEGSWNGPGYMEGTAWIYTYYVPHELPALVDTLGAERFNARLEEGFARDYVDLGNQPNLQAPFLGNYSGRPDLTHRYSRLVAEEYFGLDPLTAYRGEEDEGQMGALYCLLSMGLFEMGAGCAVEPYFDVSVPVFERVTIHLDADYFPGGTFVIRREGGGEGPWEALLDGEPLEGWRLPFAAVVAGGELVVRRVGSGK